ncbi:hypothetical protein [Streptomyces sp. ISL-100]|uniref:hypothetical protein n=1 Tax=Streptomyces sp. ISL-100 TaxID=2819173 RepID=UPI001BEA71DE|nr:hypothetical protein [Streptomyces sp. ISL-100]MBT2397847.1 hypothetical protein [Streptomyces sp. ISL-100]
MLVLCGLEWQSDPDDDTAPSLPRARADVYLPLPRMRRLLVMSLTTPSLPDLPFYVSLLSKSAHDLTISSGVEPPPASGPENGGERRARTSDQVRADVG